MDEVIIQPRWQGKSKSIKPSQKIIIKKKKKQHKVMGEPLGERNIHFTEQGRSIRKRGLEKIKSHHKAKF